MPQNALSRPSAADTLGNACAKAAQLQIAGHLDLAEQLYRSVLTAEPRHAAANHGVGLLHLRAQRPADGLPHLLIALEAAPDSSDYWLGYLEALLAAGSLDDAKGALSLGREHGLAGAAVEDFTRRLLARLPRPAPAKPPVGIFKETTAERRRDSRIRRQERKLFGLVKQRRTAEAIATARAMTKSHPDNGAAWKALGFVSWTEGNKEQALAAMRTAVTLLPGDVEAHRNLALTLVRMQLLDEAETCLRAALKLDPASAELHGRLGDVFHLQDRLVEAQDCFRRSISLQTDGSSATNEFHSRLLFLLSNISADPHDLFAEHCRFGTRFEGTLRNSWPQHANSRDPGRRLNIGIVSGDFFNHALASFIEPILVSLQNSPAVRLHAYYNNVVEDATTVHLRSCFTGWQAVSEWSDAQLATRIMADGIDILIDLSGHSGLNRLTMFARKPAPVQVTWMGYPGTTGLSAMDYYLADRYFLPPGLLDDQFTEKLVYLPANAPFRPFPAAPPVNPLPALAAGRITFGSFNRLSKISDVTVAHWSRLLSAVKDSRLIVAGIENDAQTHRLSMRLIAAGIAPDRVSYFLRGNMYDYLVLHHCVDMCLDTFPYSGGTTTCHALWMGVPTLTIAGSTPAGRQGAVMLGHLGLGEFVATDQADFVAKGVHWSKHLPELAALRAGIRDTWQQSPDLRPDVIAAGLERALRQMWSRWCARQSPESFHSG